jgi:4-amino-4-deoxy-L-arabinose transferase-like glycosyltransferase
MATSGNMWFVVDNMLGIAPPDWLPGSVALAALGAAGCWLWYHSRRSDPLVLVLAGTALLVVVFQVAYRMSAPPYLGPAVAAFLTLGAITGRWHIVPLAIWSGLWCFEESFWYFMHFGAPEGNVLRTAFLAYDLPVTGLSLLVAWFAAKAIRESQTAGHQPGGIPIPPGTMAN